MSVAALAATLLISSVTVNRLVRRKLKLSIVLFSAYALAHVALWISGTTLAPEADERFRSFEDLGFAAALINLIVVSVVNPLRHDRIPERFPAILQDAMIIGLLLLVSTLLLNEKLLTTSAVGAVVLGFALQDTLGNAIAGLALQTERPFNIGHWIRVADFEGRVAEITWRATKLRTKTGNFVIVPNNIIAKEAITNYSEPAAPTRLEVEVGAAYQSTPMQVKAAIREALAQCPRVLQAPAPEINLLSFGDFAVNYRVWFWIDDYEMDDEGRDEVRTAIFYAFGRRGIEIPYPVEVGYDREWPEPDSATKRRMREELIAGVDMFSDLSEEQRRQLAAVTETRVFGNGETIVRQGDPGDSLYIVVSGAAAVLLEPDRREFARIEKGGYFGEMSLLTGEPRTASVVARGDVTVLELDANVFRIFGEQNPAAIEQIGVAAMTRRAELDQVRTAAQGSAVAEAPATFLSRMKRFLRLR